MTVDWIFEKKRKSQKSRDPMQASFFTNASIDDDTHALVREAIQNSLDAKSDKKSNKPVKAVFSIGNHLATNGVMSKYISNSAWEHFNAVDNGLKSPPSNNSNCRYLVFEDFNTKGLVGDETAFEPEPNNSFYFFMRAEGQSGKHDGDLGRHGIGKYVFPYLSSIRMFISATVRSTDNRCLISGQCVLKSHHIKESKFNQSGIYTPDGWWGICEDEGDGDYSTLPVNDQSLYTQLANDFGLERKLDESGLSLIIPYIQKDVTVAKISEHVIREYFWPIIEGSLIVEVKDGSRNLCISQETMHNNLSELLEPEQLKQIEPFTTLAFKALKGNKYPSFELSLSKRPYMPFWDKAYLPKNIAKDIQRELLKPDAFIRVRCPLYVQLKSSDSADKSFFDIFLSKDISDLSTRPLFMREGILIPEDRVQKIRGYNCMIIINKGPLASLLGDSENPAHTEWEKNAVKFKGKYYWGTKTIDFVRGAVSKFMNLMSQGDEEEDVAILSDIFPLTLIDNDEDIPYSRKKELSPARGGETKDTTIDFPPPLPPSRPRKYKLTKSESGFELKGPEVPFDSTMKYEVLVAFDFAGASKTSALKKWHKNDFDFASAKNVGEPHSENLTLTKLTGNSIEFIAENNDFKLSVEGFDNRRDIIVDVKSEEMHEEV